jgi:hypothetical protein
MPLRTPQGKSEVAHLGLKRQPLLLCGLGLALSGGTEVAALLLPSIVEEENDGEP